MKKVAGHNMNLNAKYLREQYVLLCMTKCREDIEGQRWFRMDFLEDEQGLSMGGMLALLKYPFYPLFILDNGMNLISKSLTVLTLA